MILPKSDTLLEAIEVARTAGFTEDFMYKGGLLIGRNSKNKYGNADCTLIEYCRFEGWGSDPSDASILFLIECTDGLKGCLSSAYGNDADTELTEFVLSIKKETVKK